MASIRLLLVEDSDDDAMLIHLLIRRELPTAELTRVERFPDFAAELNRHVFDAVVCDYILQGFTGMDVLAHIRKYEFDIPFILISGTVGEDIAVEAVKSGAADYVMKDNLARLPTSIVREVNANEIRRQRRVSEKHLMVQQANMAALLENTTDCIWSINRNLQISIINTSAKSCFKRHFGAEMAEGSYFPDLLPTAVIPQWDNLIKSAFMGRKGTHEVRFGGEPDSPFMEISINPIYGTDKRVGGVSFFAKDISERKAIEQRLSASLKEKEILLAEVHHRVKNNLAIISGILALHQDRFPDSDVQAVYTEAITKIKSIALIHELLYTNDSFESIRFGTYLKTLILYISESLVGMHPLSIVVDADSTELHLSKAVPCGLIVSELVTNAIKHAFRDGENGTITVVFRQSDSGFRLDVRDNGTRLAGTADLAREGAIGTELVRGLAEQIGATIRYELDEGTAIILESCPHLS